jgi:hypothetical protein
MMSSIAKTLLVATSVAPVFLTLWFKEFSSAWAIEDGIVYLLVAVGLVILCLVILAVVRDGLGEMPIRIETISTADKEIVSFLLIYLLPLVDAATVSLSTPVMGFVVALFFVTILTTHSYHFNPVLGLFGYHFYEVTIEGGTSYVLITRRNLAHGKEIKTVVQLAEYMIIEAKE